MISKTNALLVVAAWCLCFASLVHGGEKKPPGSTLASRVEGMLDAMKETHYQAQTEIDEENGSLRCDCSGLLCYVLRHDFPEAYLSLRGDESPWRTRPYSVTFYETFISAGDEGVGEGGWRRIRKMMDVRPGDVLAWRKDTIERGVSTGHTCMIASLPKTEKDGRVRVRVIDSTRKQHANDTRTPGTTGVGAGEMWFLVNPAGEPIGFFVDGSGVQAKSTKVAVGRLIGAGGPPISPPGETGAPARAEEEYVTEPDDAQFIGLEKAAAIALAEKSKHQWRIVREDEAIEPVSMRLNNDRVNFVLAKGKVIRVRRG